MKVLVRGPALTRTGYGEHVRFILRALHTQPHLDIYLIPVGWGQTGWVVENDEEKQWLDSLAMKAQIAIQQKQIFDISIQVTIPNEWEKLAAINIGVTAGIETTKVAPVWLEKANMMDKIIVPSQHSKNVFENTSYSAVVKETKQEIVYKCETPIEVIGYPVKDHSKCDLDLDFKTDFNFLNVAQWGPRKNMENCIRWFVEEFHNDEKVGLVLKANIVKNCLMDKRTTIHNIQLLLNNEKHKDRKCKIYLLHGDLSDQEMHQLYRHPKIKALVSTSHGEGFGLPMFEAAYEGMPLIAPEWGGYLDFLCMPIKNKKGKEKIKPMFANVDYSLQQVQKQAVWDGVIQADSKWCFATEGSFKKRLRDVYKDPGRFKKQAKQLQGWIRENFSEQRQYKKIIDNIVEYQSDTNLYNDVFQDIITQTLI